MNKFIPRDYLKLFLLFVGLIIVDQFTKQLSHSYTDVVYNQGLVFGMYKSVPPFIRISLISSFFGVIFFLYIIFMYLISIKNMRLKYAITLLVAGIGGNVFSKIVFAKTIDFIPVILFSYRISFNLADVFQWLGLMLTFYYFFMARNTNLWAGLEKRGNYLIHPKEQFSFSVKLCLVSFCSSFLLGIFSYTFIKTIFSQLDIPGLDDSVLMYLVTYVLLSFFFTILVAVVGIVISHRIAGPFIAFERYVEGLLTGRGGKFRLRESDKFRDLERIADKLSEKIKED